MTLDTQPEIGQRTFAKFGGIHWYAILPHMEKQLRKAGAEISIEAIEITTQQSKCKQAMPVA
jgi:hypothetical protein